METTTASLTRNQYTSQEAKIDFHCQCGNSFQIFENTGFVDGIGGIIWDGALVLSNVLENINANNQTMGNPDCHVVDLGCGTGLCGITAAKLGYRTTLTDRECDLATVNIKHAFPEGRSVVDIEPVNLSWECSTGSDNAIRTEEQEMSVTAKDLLKLRGKGDIIVGAEITVLIKQQPILVNTIADLCDGNPLAVVLLSFDEAPLTDRSKYESEMIARMLERGFRHLVVSVADCNWTCSSFKRPPTGSEEKSSGGGYTHKTSVAVLRDRTAEFCDLQSSLLRPFLSRRDCCVTTRSEGKECFGESSEAKLKNALPTPPQCSQPKSHPPIPDVGNATTEDECTTGNTVTRVSYETTTHHITAFFRPSAVGVCRRCHHEYFLLPSLLSECACEYHDSIYVCRYHPAEVRCSIDGLGDGLGYYGNGKEDYDAKFWDCCGAEDRNAKGCCRSSHQKY